MPQQGRKNLTVLETVVDQARKRYENDHGDKSFIKWVSEYLLMNLEKDEFVGKYFQYLSFVGVHDNVLIIKDSRKPMFIEIRKIKGKLHSSDDDPIYLQFALAIPELSRLNDK